MMRVKVNIPGLNTERYIDIEANINKKQKYEKHKYKIEGEGALLRGKVNLRALNTER